jgi:hypothetical protein
MGIYEMTDLKCLAMVSEQPTYMCNRFNMMESSLSGSSKQSDCIIFLISVDAMSLFDSSACGSVM